MIVPLGETYLELISVVDRSSAEAAQSPIGRWVGMAPRSGVHPLGWSVRTHDVDAVAQRLGLQVGEGSRVTQDGRVLRWRSAGVETAAAEPALPFFIQWTEGTLHPGDIRVAHPAGAVRISQVRLQAEPDRLESWLGPHQLPLRVRRGTPALTSVVLTGDAGDVVLGDGE
jgi:hypothetical protein